MTKQPQVRSTVEALRLAELLEVAANAAPERDEGWLKIAAELRRLHEVNQELLEALKQILVGAQSQGPHTGMSWFNVETIAKTTIAKAGERP